MASKIGILSDIHADLFSLTQALAVLERHQVEHILCAGDLVDRGYEGDLVVRRIEKLGIQTVMGNHDEDITLDEEDWLHPNRADYERVNEHSLRYLENLPYTLELTVEGTELMVTHGSPEDNTEYLFHNCSEYIFQAALENSAGDVLIVGHTHTPMRIEVADYGLILNPGSVCQFASRDSGTCAVLTVPSCEFVVYDIDTGHVVQFVSRKVG